jgi:hypothetical protein
MMDLPLVIHMLTSGPTLHRDYFLGFENMATWSSVVSDTICVVPLPPSPLKIDPIYVCIVIIIIIITI